MIFLGALLLLAVLSFVGSAIILVWAVRSPTGTPPADLHAVDVAIPSGSGSMIRGWLVRGRPGSGVVVLLHGVYDSRRTLIARMRFLRDAGYSLLAVDFQAHGESPGTFVTFGHLEAIDAQAAVAFARAELPGERVGVIGISLGGAAALLGPRPLPVDALVLEAVYPDIRSAIANRISSYLGPPAGRLLASLYLKLMPPLLGVREEQLRPIDQIAGATAPLLVMSGTVDRYTTISQSCELFARAPEPKQFWAVDGAGHVDLAAHAPEAYRETVLTFFSKYLRGAAVIPK
jgi:uncharacterized protein